MWPELDSVVELLRSLWAAAAVFWAAFGFGRPLVRQLRLESGGCLAVGVWSIATGLVVAGWLLWVLAALGGIHVIVIAALTLVGAIWALVELACACLGRVARARSTPQHREGAHRSRWLAGGLALLSASAAAVLLASLAIALAPPTSVAVLSDALERPKNVLVAQGAGLTEPGGCSLIQTWWLWALALDGPVAANLVHWGVGLLLVLATVLLARVLLGSPAAWIAGGLILLSPGVQRHLGDAGFDQLPCALLATLAVLGACQVLVQFESARAAVAAGLMLGAAAATQPAGAFLAVALAVSWAAAVGTAPWRRRELAISGGALLATATVVAGPALAGTASWPDALAWYSLRGEVASLGPVLLIGLGGLAFARRLRGLGHVSIVLVAYLAGGALSRGEWWTAAVPLVAVVSTWVWIETLRLPRPQAIVIVGVVALVAGAGLGPLLEKSYDRWPVALGRLRRDEFLLAREPGFRAAALVSQICQPDDRALVQDASGLYFPCRTESSSRCWRPLVALPGGGGPRRLIRAAQRAGYAYLLLAEPVVDDSKAATGDRSQLAARYLEQRLLDRSTDDGEVVRILQYRFADSNHRHIRYRLLKLRRLPATTALSPPDRDVHRLERR